MGIELRKKENRSLDGLQMNMGEFLNVSAIQMSRHNQDQDVQVTMAT